MHLYTHNIHVIMHDIYVDRDNPHHYGKPIFNWIYNDVYVYIYIHMAPKKNNVEKMAKKRSAARRHRPCNQDVLLPGAPEIYE